MRDGCMVRAGNMTIKQGDAFFGAALRNQRRSAIWLMPQRAEFAFGQGASNPFRKV